MGANMAIGGRGEGGGAGIRLSSLFLVSQHTATIKAMAQKRHTKRSDTEGSIVLFWVPQVFSNFPLCGYGAALELTTES